MAGWFNLKYLNEPSSSKGAGMGAGVAAIGDGISRLGEIGAQRQIKEDEQTQRALENERAKTNQEMAQKQLDATIAYQNANLDNANKTLEWNKELANKKLDYERAKLANDNKFKERELNLKYEADARELKDRATNVALFKKLYPEQTNGLSDDEVYFLGARLEKEYKANTQNTKKDTNADEWVPVTAEFYKENLGNFNGMSKSDKDGFFVRRGYLDALRANNPNALNGLISEQLKSEINKSINDTYDDRM